LGGGADDYREIESKVAVRVFGIFCCLVCCFFFFLFTVEIVDPLNNNMPFIFITILKEKRFSDFIDLVLSSV